MQFGNVAFIIWRESVEALLVIGILNAWLAQQPETLARKGRVYLWSGVVAGLGVAALLGAALIYFAETLSDDVQQIYQTVIVLVAAVLIVQMVFWMRRHGRTLKRDIETSLTTARANANWWRVFLLALVAVAREGSETVVFLSGTLEAARHGALGAALVAAALGFTLALATYGALQMGSRILSWRTFFRITEILLLLLAGALLMTSVDNLVSLDVLPTLSGRLWDTSRLLPDGGPVGGLISALTGYRAKPSGVEVLVLLSYWAALAAILFRPRAAVARA